MKHKLTLILLVCGSLIAIVWLITGNQILAQSQDFKMALSPPLLETMIKPGKTITQSYWISNQGQAQDYMAMIVPFQAKGRYGQSEWLVNPTLLTQKNQVNQLQNQYPWLGWFSLVNVDIDLWQPFTIKAKSRQQLVLKIKVPDHASQKDYYASLIIFPLTNQPSLNPGNQTIIGGGISSHVLLTVSFSGQPEQKLQISQLRLNQTCILGQCLPLIDSLQPINIWVTAANKGQTLVKSVGKVQIKKGAKTVFTQIILPENVLADSQRQLRPSECLKAEKPCTFSYQPHWLSWGKYQINTSLTSPDDQDIKSINIYYLPIKIIFTLILLSLGWRIVLDKLT